jgi:TetR/AcrR family transcriptional repressor of nem operon
MGRPREFDPDEALEAAMEVFWRKGYQNTSVGDLLEAMAINRWSMYQTFGEKPKLFLKALELYRGRWSAFIRAQIEGHASPRAALFALIRAMGDQIVADRLHRGCLIANSAFELAALEPEAARVVTDGLRRLENAIADLVARAQAAGELTTREDPRRLARFLIASVNGIRAAGRVESDAHRARLAELIEVTLSVLH